MDQSYNTIATVKAGNHEFADLHEFEITADNTALLTIYTREMADLTSFGVTEQAWITNCKFQEIDISTGKVRLLTVYFSGGLMGRPYLSGKLIRMSI